MEHQDKQGKPPSNKSQDAATVQVCRAIDLLSPDVADTAEVVLRRIAGRLPRDFKAACELAWMRRVSGVAAGLFLALFAADYFDLVQTAGHYPAGQYSDSASDSAATAHFATASGFAASSPLATIDEAPLPAWVAIEQGGLGRFSKESWIVDQLLIGEVAE